MTQELSQLTQVQLLRRRLNNTLIIQPHQIANVEQAASEAVKKLLFTFFDQDFQAIIIQVNKIVVEKQLIRTFDDSPCLFLDIAYSLTLLTIPVGTFIQGCIVQQYQSHIIIQIFNLFNVTVTEDMINSKSLKWCEEFQAFVDQRI